MEKRIYSVVSRVLKVPLKSIDESSSPDTIESWDSLSHLQLVLALEEEYDLQFSVDEIGALQRVGTIVAIIRERLGSNGASSQ